MARGRLPMSVVRRPILTPLHQAISMTYRAHRRPTCAPINSAARRTDFRPAGTCAARHLWPHGLTRRSD